MAEPIDLAQVQALLKARARRLTAPAGTLAHDVERAIQARRAGAVPGASA